MLSLAVIFAAQMSYQVSVPPLLATLNQMESKETKWSEIHNQIHFITVINSYYFLAQVPTISQHIGALRVCPYWDNKTNQFY